MLEIRPYKSCDAKHILSWIDNQTKFYRWCADVYDRYPISENDINNFYNSEQSKQTIKMTAVDNSDIVGHFTIRFTDKQKSVARLGFVIINDKIRGQGIGKKLIALALKYSFETLKARKVTLAVFKNNPAAYNCYKSAGFKEVASPNPESYTMTRRKMGLLRNGIPKKQSS